MSQDQPPAILLFDCDCFEGFTEGLRQSDVKLVLTTCLLNSYFSHVSDSDQGGNKTARALKRLGSQASPGERRQASAGVFLLQELAYQRTSRIVKCKIILRNKSVAPDLRTERDSDGLKQLSVKVGKSGFMPG
jgi:hypothetical protein